MLLAEVVARHDTRESASQKSDDGTPEQVRSAVQHELFNELGRLRKDTPPLYPNIMPIIDQMLQEDPLKRITVRDAIGAVDRAFKTVGIREYLVRTPDSLYEKLAHTTVLHAVANALGVPVDKIIGAGSIKG